MKHQYQDHRSWLVSKKKLPVCIVETVTSQIMTPELPISVTVFSRAQEKCPSYRQQCGPHSSRRRGGVECREQCVHLCLSSLKTYPERKQETVPVTLCVGKVRQIDSTKSLNHELSLAWVVPRPHGVTAVLWWERTCSRPQ